MKNKVISLVISVVMLMSCFGVSVMAETEVADVVTFGVFSDTHNNSAGIANAFNNIYSLSNNGADLDGVVMNGDIVYMQKDETPSASHYETLLANAKYQELKNAGKLVYEMGNHEFPLSSANNETLTSQSKVTFTEQTGFQTQSHTVLSGYHFITSAPENYNGSMQYAEEYMTEELNEALSDETEKPVFLIVHHAVQGSVYDSPSRATSTRYSADFINFIENQPRIIVLSGHTHHPESDPRSITQAVGGCTYVQTSHVSGGADLSDSFATHSANGKPSQAMMIEVNPETNVVTFKRFHVGTEPTLFDEDWTIDIPSMIDAKETEDTEDDKEAYRYTSLRAENSIAPSFASENAVTVNNVESTKATITFPKAIAVDSDENNEVIYYEIKLKSGDEVKKTDIIVADYYKLPQNQSETYSHTVTGLEESTNYTVEVSALTAWKVKSSAISGSFKTVEPAFSEVTLEEENTIVEAVSFSKDDSGKYTINNNENISLSGTITNYGSLLQIYKTSSNAKIAIDVNITTPGMYRIYGYVSSEGAIETNVTVKNNTSGTSKKYIRSVNTGSINTYEYVPYADCALTAGNYTITFSKPAGTYTWGFKSMKLGRFRDFTAEEIEYKIEKNVSEKSATNVAAGGQYSGVFLMSSASNYISWQVTPEFSGMYDLSFKVDSKKGVANGYLDGEQIGSVLFENSGTVAAANAKYGSVGEVALIAGQTYTVKIANQSGNETLWVCNMKLSYKGDIDFDDNSFAFRYGYTKTTVENEDGTTTDVLNYTKSTGTAYGNQVQYGKGYTVKEITVPVTANYDLAIKAGNASTRNITVSVSGLVTKTVSLASTGVATTHVDNRYILSVPLEKGKTYKVTVYNSVSQTLALCDLILTTAGNYQTPDSNELKVTLTDYTATNETTASRLSYDSVLLAAYKRYATYTMHPGAGNYKLYLTCKPNGSGTADRSAKVSIDGTEAGVKAMGNDTSAKVTLEFDNITLDDNAHSFKIEHNTAGSGNFFYLYEVKLVAISEPEVTLYSGGAVDSANIAEKLTEGTMTANAYLPKSANGNSVTMVFAIYKGNALYKIATGNVAEASKNDSVYAIMDNIDFDDTSVYTSKILFVDNLEGIMPYYNNPLKGSLTN